MKLVKDVYKFELEKPYEYTHPLLEGLDVENEWMKIKDSTIFISEKYAWNGCSASYTVLGIWEFGTPEGALVQGKPWTYYCSLVHDCLTQFKDDINITKDDSITIFSDSLKEVEFPLESVYTLGLKLFFKAEFLGDK